MNLMLFEMKIGDFSNYVYLKIPDYCDKGLTLASLEAI